MNAAVESNNVQLSAEELQLLTAFRGKDFNKVVKIVGTGINRAEEAAQKAKTTDTLETLSCELVHILDQSIDDLAYRLANSRGEKGRYAESFAADDLLLSLSGFLVHAHFDHADEGEMAKRFHLSDPAFAFDWFDVTTLTDGTLVPVE